MNEKEIKTQHNSCNLELARATKSGLICSMNKLARADKITTGDLSNNFTTFMSEKPRNDVSQLQRKKGGIIFRPSFRALPCKSKRLTATWSLQPLTISQTLLPGVKALQQHLLSKHDKCP